MVRLLLLLKRRIAEIVILKPYRHKQYMQVVLSRNQDDRYLAVLLDLRVISRF